MHVRKQWPQAQQHVYLILACLDGVHRQCVVFPQTDPMINEAAGYRRELLLRGAFECWPLPLLFSFPSIQNFVGTVVRTLKRIVAPLHEWTTFSVAAPQPACMHTEPQPVHINFSCQIAHKLHVHDLHASGCCGGAALVWGCAADVAAAQVFSLTICRADKNVYVQRGLL